MFDRLREIGEYAIGFNAYAAQNPSRKTRNLNSVPMVGT